MKVKESEKIGLNLNIQKIKTMASGPIISWQIDGESLYVNFLSSPLNTVSSLHIRFGTCMSFLKY